VTLSIGVGLLDERATAGSSALIALADQRLYSAKAKGRNCVVAE
jgi:GGDEF domain-containing protein